MNDPRVVLCETCGSEGRIIRLSGRRDEYGCPEEVDEGECPYCEGTGGEIIETQPIEEEDLAVNYEQEDDREMMDIEPGQPLGKVPVKFDVPMPTIEQVSGEIARQIIQSESYQNRNELRRRASDALDSMIEKIVTERAMPIIETLLDKPLQPTDGFGNPVGEPTSLHAVLAQHVTQWATTPVNRDGLPSKGDHYNKPSPRIDWALGAIVNGELKKQVDEEVKKISATLKAGATNTIAKQIAEAVSKVMFK